MLQLLLEVKCKPFICFLTCLISKLNLPQRLVLEIIADYEFLYFQFMMMLKRAKVLEITTVSAIISNTVLAKVVIISCFLNIFQKHKNLY